MSRIIMGSAQLMFVDDLVKMLLVDPKLKLISKKIRINYTNKDVSEELKLIHADQLVINFNIDETIEKLLSFATQHKLYYFFNVTYKQWLAQHLKIYLHVLHPNSKVLIKKCSKYTLDNHEGIAVFAKTNLKKGEVLYIVGILKQITLEEEEDLRIKKLNFSIMHTTRSQTPMIMLGPAALLNHECDPNCAFKSYKKSVVVIVTIKDIRKGDELFCYYGKNYFGDANENCECLTCEKNNEGVFRNLLDPSLPITQNYEEETSLSSVAVEPSQPMNKNSKVDYVVRNNEFDNQNDKPKEISKKCILNQCSINIEKSCISKEKEKFESIQQNLTTSDKKLTAKGPVLHIIQNSTQDGTALSSVAVPLCEPMNKSFGENLSEEITIKVDEASSNVDFILDGNTESNNQNIKQKNNLKESTLNQSTHAMEKSCVPDEKEKFANIELTLTTNDKEFTVEEKTSKNEKYVERNNINFSLTKTCNKLCIVCLTRISPNVLNNKLSQSEILETKDRQNQLWETEESRKNVQLTNDRIVSKPDLQNRRKVIEGQGKCNTTKKRQRAFCPYCLVNVSKFNYHLENWHSDEHEVKLFLRKNLTRQERRSIIISIRHKGYGEKFKRTKCITPVSKYKNSGESNKVQCRYCKGHYSKKTLWKHNNSCYARFLNN